MLEFHCATSDVVGCFARPEALDELTSPDDLNIRIAPDELLLLGCRNRITQLETELAAHDGLALDLSGGYAVYSLRGDDRIEVLTRLCAVPIPGPPAVVQGLVAHLPAKVIVRDDEVVLVVPATVAHHLRARVLTACSDLAPVESRDGAAVEEAAPA